MHELARRQAALEEELETLLRQAVRDRRLEGDAYYSNYQFQEAQRAYERALESLSQHERPILWASTLVDVGRA